MKTVLILLFTFASTFAQLPLCDCDQIITHGDYTICYSEQHEQSRWVAYTLTVKNIMCRGRRKNDFRTDPLVETESASMMDYYQSGYDRGHLAPSADFKCNTSITFFMSNMSPQHPRFNRGIWKKLEKWVREKALENGELRVVTGPVLTDGLPTIGYNMVSIPNYFYKVVLGPTVAIGFILPNRPSRKRVESFAVSIDSVEKFTGIDFYSDLPDSTEEFLESLGRM